MNSAAHTETSGAHTMSPASPAPTRILFIDSYDSFSYNVVRLIEQQGTPAHPVEVTVVHNDTFADVDALAPYLPLFTGIVVGPGPGNPENGAADIGVIAALFRDARLATVPILGICLGFQAMCHAQGAAVAELAVIKHGQVYDIAVDASVSDTDTEIFRDYPATFKSTRYHSLHVVTSADTPTVVPLAHTADENGALLMAARIAGRPWYGVQYHPESCCSELGARLLQNFLRIAGGQRPVQPSGSGIPARLRALQRTIDLTPIAAEEEKPADPAETDNRVPCITTFEAPTDPALTFRLCDALPGDKFVLASAAVSAHRGEWSVVAVPSARSVVYTHYAALRRTSVHRWRDPAVPVAAVADALRAAEPLESSALTVRHEDRDAFWHTLGAVMRARECSARPDIPFVGGLVGILGYEMGQGVRPARESGGDGLPRPDAKLVYVEECIVINHAAGKLYAIGHEFPERLTWAIVSVLGKVRRERRDCGESGASATAPGVAGGNGAWPTTLPSHISYDITLPDKDAYARAFAQCQRYMHRGDSYEMCLTTQTSVRPSASLAPWRIFQTLVARNPAPFASYLHFNDLVDGPPDNVLSFVSTSPERFLQWGPDACELRPIKGTVRKGPRMTRALAAEILRSPKEFGENLMILDLIRNDLHELLADVSVDEFMSVEEYASVYQLVSVVTARGLMASPYSGADVLRHSLPAGSMTGAPKRITVQLLQDEIEASLNSGVIGDESGTRGMYSGVTGYWSANGNGDWSVNIRCMYSYDGGREWRLGAGGAITVLSSLEGELDEMYAKLESALQVFQQ